MDLKHWLMQRRLGIAFAALIAIGFVGLIYWPVYHQANVCSYEAAPGGPAANPGNAAAKVAQPNIQDHGWIHRTICKSDMTDIALVFFTYCLVIIGWATMRSNELTMREIERARVFAGPYSNVQPLLDGTFEIGIQWVNQGRTTGILKELCYRFSLEGPVGKNPDYTGFESKRYDISIEPHFLPEGPSRKLVTPYGGIQYCYGFVRYQDVFGVMHFSRFSCKVDPVNGTIDVHGPPAWSRDT